MSGKATFSRTVSGASRLGLWKIIATGPGRSASPSPIPGQVDRPHGRLVKPSEQVEQRRLARAGRPDQRRSSRRGRPRSRGLEGHGGGARPRRRCGQRRRSARAADASSLEPPVAQPDLAIAAAETAALWVTTTHGRALPRRSRSRSITRPAVSSSSSPVGSSARASRWAVGEGDRQARAGELAAGELAGARVRAPGRVRTCSSTSSRQSSSPAESPRRCATARFSATERWPIRFACWYTTPTWRARSRARSSSERRDIRSPATWTVPPSGSSSPARQASRVDLPDPEGPVTATSSPGSSRQRDTPAARASRRRRRGRSGTGCAPRGRRSCRPPHRVRHDPPRVDVVGTLGPGQRQRPAACRCGRRRSARLRRSPPSRSPALGGARGQVGDPDRVPGRRATADRRREGLDRASSAARLPATVSGAGAGDSSKPDRC